MDKNGIALFCTLHPASTEKQAIVKTLYYFYAITRN